MNALDHALFQWINSGLSNAVFDFWMPFFREKLFWLPLYLFIGLFSILNFGKKGWLIVLGICLSAGISDVFNSRLVKHVFQRPRPCNELIFREKVELRASCGSGYSFASSHASNHFAVAVFLILSYGRRWRWVRPALLAWAGSIAFAQVYVGVHFPGDVLAGAMLGVGVGWLVFLFFRKKCKSLATHWISFF